MIPFLFLSSFCYVLPFQLLRKKERRARVKEKEKSETRRFEISELSTNTGYEKR